VVSKKDFISFHPGLVKLGKLVFCNKIDIDEDDLSEVEKAHFLTSSNKIVLKIQVDMQDGAVNTVG